MTSLRRLSHQEIKNHLISSFQEVVTAEPLPETFFQKSFLAGARKFNMLR